MYLYDFEINCVRISGEYFSLRSVIGKENMVQGQFRQALCHTNEPLTRNPSTIALLFLYFVARNSSSMILVNNTTMVQAREEVLIESGAVIRQPNMTYYTQHCVIVG